MPVKPVRKSIYEQSSDDEDSQKDDNIRSPSDEDNDSQTFSLSKDKDMRFSAIFMDSKDSSNGDIDLRLPFKPLANYEPATEIDASIYSHEKIVYEVIDKSNSFFALAACDTVFNFIFCRIFSNKFCTI